MALKHTTGATGLTKSAFVNGSALTILQRARPDAILSFGAFMASQDGFSNQNILQFNGSTAGVFVAGSTVSTDILSVTLGRWYDCALTFDGAANGSLIGYLGLTGDYASALSSASAAGLRTNSSASLRIGSGAGGEEFNGAHCDVMVWTAVLTAAELEFQRRFRVPVVRLDKLWAWIPLPHATDALDYSGNARHFTSTATQTVEDPLVTPERPSWAGLRQRVLYMPAAGGGGDTPLDAASATYAVTGASATTLVGRAEPASAGTYSLTGAAATTVVSRSVAGAAGTYCLTGADATTEYSATPAAIDASAASYALTGAAATFAVGFVGSAASYAITGSVAGFAVGGAASPATYAYTGASATTDYSGAPPVVVRPSDRRRRFAAVRLR